MAVELSDRQEIKNYFTRRDPLAPQGESLLLPLVAIGDPDAVQACIDRYGGLIWSLAVRRCENREGAEDAVQDIFVHLWQVAHRHEPSIASEKTYVTMIARRRLIDRQRKKKSTTTVCESMEDIYDQTPSVLGVMEIKDEAQLVEIHLRELPDDQQQVIRLSVYESLSQAKIASMTGIPLGTVKTHIRQGLLELRTRLFSASAAETPHHGPPASRTVRAT